MVVHWRWGAGDVVLGGLVDGGPSQSQQLLLLFFCFLLFFFAFLPLPLSWSLFPFISFLFYIFFYTSHF